MKKFKFLAVFFMAFGLSFFTINSASVVAKQSPNTLSAPVDGSFDKYMTVSGACCFFCGLRTWCTSVYYPDLCTTHCQDPYPTE